MKKYLLLPALTLPVALAWESPADSVSFHPAADSSVTRTFVSNSEMTLDDMSMTMNGNPSPMPMEMEMTINMEQTVTVTDLFVDVDGAEVKKLSRTYDELGSSGSFAMEMAMADQSMDRVIEAESELEGKTVIFELEDGEYSTDFEDGDGDDELLEGLEQNMDLTALLPSDDVSEGDTWEIEVSDLKSLLLPGGDLSLEPLLDGEEEAAMGMGGMDGMNDLANMIGDLEGEAQGEYNGTRDVDGTNCGVINVTFTISTANDLTDSIEDAMGGMPEGAEVEIDHIDVEMEMEGEGVLLWNLGAGIVHSFEMTSEVETTMDMGMAMSMGEMSVDIEQTMEMSGNQSLNVTVANN